MNKALWFQALDELNRPLPFGTNAAAVIMLGPQARACEWDPEADRPSHNRGKFHGLAAMKMGEGERALRVCRTCSTRYAARYYARVSVLQPGRVLREIKR